MTRPPKAYERMSFLTSPDARTVRILCEYLEPLQRLRRKGIRDTVVVFGSARARPPEEVERELAGLRGRKDASARRRIAELERQRALSRYYADAMEFAQLVTEWGRTLRPPHRCVICSGGGPGVMEAANRGATQKAHGSSIGLTISLPREERPNPYISPDLVFEFHYFFMRKLWFVYPALALVVFPGGFGTMDELFEVLTLVQTRKVDRPLPIVIYGRSYWNDVLDFNALVRWGTISREDLRLFQWADSPEECFRIVRSAILRHYPRPRTALAFPGHDRS